MEKGNIEFFGRANEAAGGILVPQEVRDYFMNNMRRPRYVFGTPMFSELLIPENGEEGRVFFGGWEGHVWEIHFSPDKEEQVTAPVIEEGKIPYIAKTYFENLRGGIASAQLEAIKTKYNDSVHGPMTLCLCIIEGNYDCVNVYGDGYIQTGAHWFPGYIL